MDSVAWNADDPLHNVETRGLRRKKYNNVSAPNLVIRNRKPRPRSCRSKLDTVDKDVVPYKQGVLHRTRRDRKPLHHENDDEETSGKHPGERSQKFDLGFLRLGFILRFALFALSFCHLLLLARSSIAQSAYFGEIRPLRCAGINRHEAEDERASRERSSD